MPQVSNSVLCNWSSLKYIVISSLMSCRFSNSPIKWIKSLVVLLVVGLRIVSVKLFIVIFREFCSLNFNQFVCFVAVVVFIFQFQFFLIFWNTLLFVFTSSIMLQCIFSKQYRNFSISSSGHVQIDTRFENKPKRAVASFPLGLLSR